MDTHNQNDVVVMRVPVFKSSLTPGLTNAVDVFLPVGKRVKYRLLLSEQVVGGIVSSDLKWHEHNGEKVMGYEVLFDDTGALGFADWARIIDWEDKP